MVEQAALASLTALNPGWEYNYFTDPEVETFIDREFPEYRPTFDGFRYPIQKIDFFRYLAVYRLGGFYFDLDVFLTQSLADLTHCSCVFPFEELSLNSFLRDECGMDWELGNYAFGATPEHPFLLAVIKNCVRAQQDQAWIAPMMAGIPSFFRADFEVLNTTGPGLVSRTLAECPELSRDVTILFPDDVCDSRTWHQFGNFGIHLMAASWRSRGGLLRRKLAGLWENHKRKQLLRASRRLGKCRALPTAAPSL